MRFSMLYSGEQILSFKSCLVLYAGDSLTNHQIFRQSFHADSGQVCQITLTKFSIYTSKFHFAHEHIAYILAIKLYHMSQYTSGIFYNKPDLQKIICSWERSFNVGSELL